MSRSLANFWVDGYKTGIGESNENIQTINALRKEFEMRIKDIEKEIKALEKDTVRSEEHTSELQS